MTLAHKNFGIFLKAEGMPEINPMMILHGSEEIEIFKPIVPDQTYKVVAKFIDFQDKGKLTVGLAENLIYSTDNLKEPCVRIVSQLIIRGLGGFGHKGIVKLTDFPNRPDRVPDHVAEDLILPGQAFLYRLNGDKNPLHVDPDGAQMVGFERPIIHGLCTMGTCARTVFEKFCNGNADLVKKVGSRFTAHVYPGEHLVVEMWKVSPSIVYYEAKVKERGTVALKGFMELRADAKL